MADHTSDGTTVQPPEASAFAAVEWVDIPTRGAGSENLALDPSAFSEGLSLVAVIADYGDGQDVLDLSDLLASLSALPPTNAVDTAAATDVLTSASAANPVDSNGAVAGGSFEEVASLTGVHATIAILYDENQPNHTPTVT